MGKYSTDENYWENTSGDFFTSAHHFWIKASNLMLIFYVNIRAAWINFVCIDQKYVFQRKIGKFEEKKKIKDQWKNFVKQNEKNT